MLKKSRATSVTIVEPALKLIRKTAFDECAISDARVRNEHFYDALISGKYANIIFRLFQNAENANFEAFRKPCINRTKVKIYSYNFSKAA